MYMYMYMYFNIITIELVYLNSTSYVITQLSCLGYLSDWFREQPDVLQAVLPMILNGLSEPSVSASASLAFRDVCGECSNLLAPCVIQVIPACQASISIYTLCVGSVAIVSIVQASISIIYCVWGSECSH